MWSNVRFVSWTIVFCFTCFWGFGSAQWAFDDEGCRTPDRGVGNCISLSECEPMLTVLKTLKRPISPSAQHKLQAYTCGSDSRGVKVCCPPDPIILEESKPPPSPSAPIGDTPPDVSNHKNLNLLPKDCGYLETNDKIVNGVNANLNEFPWMALVRYKGGKGLGFNCGATIINKNYILTAGHCIVGLENKLVSVRVGEHNLKTDPDCENSNKTRKCNPPVQDLKIEEVIPHPQFGTKSFLHDIGLLRVATINLDAVNARPVCLPTKNQKSNLYENTNVIVTGWGITDTETGKTSDILQKVGIPIADKAVCTKTYAGHNIKLGKAQICAGGVNNKDSCPGDSGGPMMVATIDNTNTAKYVQEGLVSFGPKYCGVPGYPGVYTLISYYMDWILDTMRP